MKTELFSKGQGLVEYAIIIGLVAVIVSLILIILGPTIGNLFSDVNSGFQAATSKLYLL